MIKEPLNGFRTLESMPLNTQPIAAGEAVIGEAFAHRVLYANWQIRRSPRCPHRSPAWIPILSAVALLPRHRHGRDARDTL